MRMLGLIAATTAAAASAQTPSPPAPAPGIALALEAAQAAVKACAGKPVAVVVTDAAGGVKLAYVPDGTAAWVGDFAKGKAATVIRTKRASGEAAALAKTDAAIGALFEGDKSLLPFAGGLPLKVHDEMVGALAVSGASSPEQDEVCAKAGVAKIADRLR